MGRTKGSATRNRTPPEGRSRIWKAMRYMKTFDLLELEQTSGQSSANVLKYVQALVSTGYLKLTTQADGQPGKVNQYRLIRDTGPVCPMPQKDGQVWDENTRETFEPDEPLPPTGRQRAWNLMRSGQEFTTDDLAQVMSQSGARVFANRLCKAGYLEIVGGHGGRGKEGERNYRYRLIRDTGPRVPTVQRNGLVVDFNKPEVGDEHGASKEETHR